MIPLLALHSGNLDALGAAVLVVGSPIALMVGLCRAAAHPHPTRPVDDRGGEGK